MWGLAQTCFLTYPESVQRGRATPSGDALFDAILASPSGVDVHRRRLRRDLGAPRHARRAHPPRASRAARRARRARRPTGRPADDASSRSCCRPASAARPPRTRSSAIPAWRKKDRDGALRINPADAARLGVDRRRTRCGSTTQARERRSRTVEVTDTMQPGHMSLPNGLGLDYPDADGDGRRHGVAPERADVRRRPRLARRHAAATSTSAPGVEAMRRARWPDGAPHPLRRLAVPDRADHRPHRRLVDAARAARARSPARAASTSSRQSLGIPRAVLAAAARPARRRGDGRRKVAYEEHPPRYEYRLTDKGRAFWDVLAAMWRWGERLAVARGRASRPSVLVDRETGDEIRPLVVDEHTGTRSTSAAPRSAAASPFSSVFLTS